MTTRECLSIAGDIGQVDVEEGDVGHFLLEDAQALETLLGGQHRIPLLREVLVDGPP
jgi:hypothetical protein